MRTRSDLLNLNLSTHVVGTVGKVLLHYVVWPPDGWYCRVCSLL